MARRNSRLLTVGLGVAILAAGLVFRWTTTEERWGRIERRDLVIAIDVEGELEAIDTDQLGPPQIKNTWNFKIAWMAPEGSEVTVGQPVLRFDTSQIEQQLQERMVERDETQKSLEKAATDQEIERRKLEQRLAEAEARGRKTELELDVPEEVVAAAELDMARIDHRLARLEIESLQSTLAHVAARGIADTAALVGKRDRAAAKVEELRADLETMNIESPRNGTVTYVVNRWNRQKKKIGDSVWRGEKILEIPDLSRLVAEGEVAETHMGRLRVGSRVAFHLDAHPDQAYGGTVRSIRSAVEKKSRHNPKKIVHLEIELDRTDTERMRPGMRFRGEIEVERVSDSLVIPEQAVFVEPGGAVVYVRSLAGERRVSPSLGARSKDAFAVEGGLEEGDLVRLRDGAQRLER